MKVVVVLVLSLMLLVGCAAGGPVTWVKDGATEEQFRRDQMACQQYGMQSAQANGLATNMFVQMWINDEATKCLNNLGYVAQQPKQQ